MPAFDNEVDTVPDVPADEVGTFVILVQPPPCINTVELLAQCGRDMGLDLLALFLANCQDLVDEINDAWEARMWQVSMTSRSIFEPFPSVYTGKGVVLSPPPLLGGRVASRQIFEHT